MIRKINEEFLTGARTKKAVFLLSILVFIFYLFGLFIFSDIYENAFIGAIMEMASLPMLVLLLTLPVAAIIQMVKEKFSLSSFPIYSFIILSGVLILFLIN